MKYIYGISSRSKLGIKYYNELLNIMLLNVFWDVSVSKGLVYMFSGEFNTDMYKARDDAINKILLLADTYPEIEELVLIGYEIHNSFLNKVDEVPIRNFIPQINTKLKIWRQ